MQRVNAILVTAFLAGPLMGCASSTAVDSHPRLVSAMSFSQPMSVIAPRGSIAVVTRSVGLQWDQSTNTDGLVVAGYNVYYGTESRFGDLDTLISSYPNTIHLGNVTNAVAISLKGATTYYFAVTAVSQDGIESDLSEEIFYTTPLIMDLAFQFDESVTNVSVQSSTNLMTWQASSAQPTENGLWRVDADSNIPVEFFRGIGQVVPAL